MKLTHPDVQAVLDGTRPWGVAQGDAISVLKSLPANTFHVCCTSPPYYQLRSYNREADAAELGREKVPDCLGWATGHKCGCCYVCRLVAVCEEVRRVLREDGCFFLNLGDSFSRSGGDGNSVKRKHGTGSVHLLPARGAPESLGDLNLLGIPCRVALALQANGWILRADCVWIKQSPMPSPVQGWRWERCRVKLKGQLSAKKAALYAAGTGEDTYSSRVCRPGSGGVTGKMPVEYQTEWADCPGCPRCKPHDGFVLRRGSWRPTTAHEYIFMFAKSEKYYADGYAVRQRLAEATIMRDRYTRVLDDPDEQYAVAHDHESVSSPDDGANLRSWLILPSGGSSIKHYAMFPVSLPALAIKCATSEAGACPHCGSQWARVVQKKAMVVREGPKANGYKESSADGAMSRMCINGTMKEAASATTLGWRQTCKCPEHEPIGALVLDPFVGAGTTILAARRLNRRAIGVELYQENCELARERIASDCPLFNTTNTEE